MELTAFLESTAKSAIALAELTTIAADRRAHGDDVLTAFRTQIEQRSAAAQSVLDAAQTAGRDTLLASEQRDYDRQIRERDAILGLQRAVEQRTSTAAYVPPSQTPHESRTTDVSPVLTRETRMYDWLAKRGGHQYAAERGVESMSFGRIVKALALGDKRGLSPLEMRVLSEGTSSAGGFTVPSPLAARFFDRTRDAMVTMRAGVQTIPMDSNTLSIAKVLQPDSVSPSISTAAWRVENADVEESDIALGRVQFTAKTLAVLLKCSIELADDSVNISEIIERELSQQLAQELDRVILLGSGTPPEPEGVLNQDGVNVQSLNASPSDYDFILDAIGRVWANNHEPNAYIVNSSLATAIAKFKSTADSQPLRVPEVVAALAKLRTNKIPNSNSSPNDTSLYLGDWTQALLGLRTSFNIEVTRVAGDSFEKMQVWTRCFLRADVQLADATAFDVTTDIGF